MNKKIFQREFDKIFPNHEQNLNSFREYLVLKYGEEEVRKIEAASEIIDECLNKMIDDLLQY